MQREPGRQEPEDGAGDEHVGRLADEAWPIAIALVASTVLGLAATGLTLHWLTRRRAGQ